MLARERRAANMHTSAAKALHAELEASSFWRSTADNEAHLLKALMPPGRQRAGPDPATTDLATR